jgi:predicted phosphodiesterase
MVSDEIPRTRTGTRVAALYDIHGNLPALDAVLSELDAIDLDLIVIGGDIALGPMPGETLDRLSGLGRDLLWLQGNADRELVRRFDASPASTQQGSNELWQSLGDWAVGRLSPQHRDLLAQLPPTVSFDIDRLGPVLFCHGSPRSDEEMITAVSSEERLQGIVTGVEQPVIVCGHTHHQFARRAAGKRIINAGSIGMPYEGVPGVACWALLGPDVELRRTAYDFAEACDGIRHSGFAAADELIAYLASPPSAHEVANQFESFATGA